MKNGKIWMSVVVVGIIGMTMGSLCWAFVEIPDAQQREKTVLPELKSHQPMDNLQVKADAMNDKRGQAILAAPPREQELPSYKVYPGVSLILPIGGKGTVEVKVDKLVGVESSTIRIAIKAKTKDGEVLQTVTASPLIGEVSIQQKITKNVTDPDGRKRKEVDLRSLKLKKNSDGTIEVITANSFKVNGRVILKDADILQGQLDKEHSIENNREVYVVDENQKFEIHYLANGLPGFFIG